MRCPDCHCNHWNQELCQETNLRVLRSLLPAIGEKIKVRDKDKSHYPYSRILKVDGMSCGNCACHVENALNSLEGVWAQADLEKGEALVRMKQEHGNNELKQAVKDAGYVVYNIEESSELSNR